MPEASSSGLVGLSPHARRASAGQWFVFVGVDGYWDSGFVFMGWN